MKHQWEYCHQRFYTQAIGVDAALRVTPPTVMRGEHQWQLVCCNVLDNQIFYLWKRSIAKKKKRLPMIGEW